jgi:glutamate-ammonia-ligase adenylyltransferase
VSFPIRQPSLPARLARLGFTDPARAERFLADPALAGLLDPFEDVFDDGVLSALGDVPDPDQAMFGLVRLLKALDAGPAKLKVTLRSGGPVRDRLLAVLGSSAALGDHLARHPEHWSVFAEDDLPTSAPGRAAAFRSMLLTAVGADPRALEPVADLPVDEATDALRVAYRRALLAITARDLISDDPIGGHAGGGGRSGRSRRGRVEAGPRSPVASRP